MKNKSIIERVQSLYSRGVPSDDSRLSARHVYNKLISVRHRLLTQQIKKKQKVSDWNYVVLPCVELVKVPAQECSCLGDLGCAVWRTKMPIPKVLMDANRHLIQYVMSVDNGMRIEEFSREAVLYAAGNKYTKHKPKYIIENGYMYFPTNTSPKVVKIKLLPEDPIEAYKYESICKDCEECGEDCTAYDDYEFPIDGDLLDVVVEMSLQELIEVFSKNTEDRTNNSADASGEGTK